jgi:NAD(P)-dependent dehydrogenase (short-subunit alcohol dehydrogenase family)
MRALVVGGGCRGLGLARALVADGHAVRIVTRDGGRRAEIEAAGAECWPGTPDVVGTLRYALDNVTVLLWLLGTASGAPDELAALHGPRLRMLLDKTTDTTVRGVVVETAGSVDPAILGVAAEEARRAWAANEIPFALLDADPRRPDAWLPAARAAIDEVLTARRSAAA